MRKTMADYMMTELTALKAIARNEGMDFTAHFIETTILTIEDEINARETEQACVGGARGPVPLKVIAGGRS